MNIRQIAQQALDSVLREDGVFSYWNRKTETENEDPYEYCVYRTTPSDEVLAADDISYVYETGITIIYYYNMVMLDSHEQRTNIFKREEQILNVLKNAGFQVREPFDGGDIEQNGYGSIIFECGKWCYGWQNE